MTGLLYVAIVALWAAVLIPMWLRRHDDDQARRIDRHRVAMGTLARIRSEDATTASHAAARRRRTILVTLAALTLLAGGAWILGMASGWLLALCLVMLVAFAGSMALGRRLRMREEALRAMERSAAAREERNRLRLHVSPPEDRINALPSPTRTVQSARLDEVFDQTA